MAVRGAAAPKRCYRDARSAQESTRFQVIEMKLLMSARVSMVAVAVLAVATTGRAQDKNKPMPPPEPQLVRVETDDGVDIKCVYFESPVAEKAGKEVVPVILVHGWGESSSQLDRLARVLQMYGHAVIVPDLRGHGGSLRQTTRMGEVVELNFEHMKAADVGRAYEDLRAVKRYLLTEHNKAKLNIELLAAVGVREGGLIALGWSVFEWSRADLPTHKRGKDIKGVVLLSPPKTFKTLNPQNFMKQPYVAKDLQLLILVGEGDAESFEAAKALHKRFEQKRGKPPTDPQERAAKENLFLYPLDTTVQGGELLQPELRTEQYIGQFLGNRIYQRRNVYPAWEERKYD